jgi:hypothetical protein
MTRLALDDKPRPLTTRATTEQRHFGSARQARRQPRPRARAFRAIDRDRMRSHFALDFIRAHGAFAVVQIQPRDFKFAARRDETPFRQFHQPITSNRQRDTTFLEVKGIRETPRFLHPGKGKGAFLFMPPTAERDPTTFHRPRTFRRRRRRRSDRANHTQSRQRDNHRPAHRSHLEQHPFVSFNAKTPHPPTGTANPAPVLSPNSTPTPGQPAQRRRTPESPESTRAREDTARRRRERLSRRELPPAARSAALAGEEREREREMCQRR